MKTKKLIFLIIVTLCATVTALAENIYVKVTSESQLVPGKKYILAREYPSNQNNKESVAGKMPTGTNGGTITQKTLNYYTNSSYMNDRIDIDGSAGSQTFKDNVTVFELGGDSESGWTFYVSQSTLNATAGYLALSTYSNGNYGYVKVLPNVNDLAKWDIENIEGEDGYCVINHSNRNHVIMQQADNKAFGAYNTSRVNSNGDLMYESYYKACLFVELGAPILKVSVNDIALGKQSSGSFIVKGKDLVDDVTISIEGTEGFSVSPETLSAEEVNVADLNVAEGGKEVTVTYNGSAHEANATITVSCGELTELIHVTAQSNAEWVTIYIDKETADQYDYYIWAWDKTDGNNYNYFESWPGKKVKELPLTEIGTNGKKKVYEFTYRDNATGLGLILNMGNGENQTADITPKNHEIYYYTGGSGTDYQIGVPIDEVIFPDEGFRQYLWNGSHFVNKDHVVYDTNKNNTDKVLEPFEIENVDYLEIGNGAGLTKHIQNFQGLEYFPNLKEFILSSNGNGQTPVLEFETLDLTMCNNSLEIVSVSGADNMTTFELPANHPLKSLKLSKCPSMSVGTLNERLATYSSTLEELHLNYCSNFDDLDITQNNKLRILDISTTPIPSLDLTSKNDLEVLRVSATNIHNNISEQIADKSKLKELTLESNDLMAGADLNVTGKPDFERLYMRNQNNYETITLDSPNKLRYMVMNENDNLTTLSLPTLTSMQEMWIEKNPILEAHTFDLSGNTSLLQISINQNGAKSTIKGMSGQMTGLRYIATEHQLYDGNVLEVSGCENLHHLDVLDCNLDKLSVAGCTALGSKSMGNANTTFYIADNHLRALDLTGVELSYNFNLSPSSDKVDNQVVYVLDGINKYFMPDNYMYHPAYNSQSVAKITPNVAYLFYENYNPNNPGAKTHTYAVYARLKSVGEQDVDPSTGESVPTLNDLFRQAAQERAKAQAEENLTHSDLVENPDILDEVAESVVDDLGFDYNRVKRWSRFDVNYDNAITVQNNLIQVINGTKGSTTNSPRLRAAGENPPTDLDPAEISGDILLLGIYTVPEGEKEAKVSGKVSYMYDTRNTVDRPDVDNPGESNPETITDEIGYYKEQTLSGLNADKTSATGVNSNYDNTFPVEFKWEVTLSDTPEEVVTNLNSIDLNKEVAKITYVNLMGIESDRPYEGVSIVVIRYTDGSVTTTKVIR